MQSLDCADFAAWNVVGPLFVAMVPVWAILIYFLPSVAAIYRGQPNLNGIFFMNLLFGWTIAGWILALSWTLRRSAKVKRSNLRRIALGAVANDRAARRPALNYSAR
jgi:hypothetical protein